MAMHPLLNKIVPPVKAFILCVLLATTVYQNLLSQATIIFLVIVFILMSFIDYYAIQLNSDISKDYCSRLIFFVLAFWLTISIVHKSWLSIQLLKLLVLLLTALLIYTYLTSLAKILLNIAKKTTHKLPYNKLKTPTVVAVIYLINAIIWLLAYFPGYLDNDSLSQWQQVQTEQWNDWHPVINTWIFKLMTYIYNSPISMAVFQSIIYVSLMTLIFTYAIKHKVNSIAILGSILFTILIPYYSLISVFITKDVLFTYLLVILTLILIKNVKTDFIWLKRPLNQVIFFFVALLFTLMRHNDLPIILITWLILLIFYRIKKILPLHFIFIATTVLYFLITGPLYKALNVVPATPGEAYAIPTQIMGAVYVNHGYLSKQQTKLIERITPAEVWQQNFNPYNVDPIKFTNYDEEFVADHPKLILTTTVSIIIKNPKIAFKEYLKQISLIWRTNLDYPAAVLGFSHSRMAGFSTDLYNNRWEYGHQLLEKYVNKSFGRVLSPFTLPAFILILTLFNLYLIIRHLGINWILPFIPFLLNIGTFAVAIPAPVLRYMYPNYFVLIITTLIVFAIPDQKTDVN